MITSWNGSEGELFDPFQYGSLNGTIPMWYHEFRFHPACDCEEDEDHHTVAEHHMQHYSAYKQVCPHTSKQWVEVIEH